MTPCSQFPTLIPESVANIVEKDEFTFLPVPSSTSQPILEVSDAVLEIVGSRSIFAGTITVPVVAPVSPQDQHYVSIKTQVSVLYDQMSARIQMGLRNLGLSDSDSADIAQESFLRLMRHLQSGRGEENLPAWLFQVARNQAMDVYRFDKRFVRFANDPEEPECRNDELPHDAPSPEEVLIGNEATERLKQALQELSEQQRRCVLLWSEDLCYREIGEILGVSVQRVGVLVERGIARLAAIM